MADHFPRTSAPASSPTRRLIAVGIIGRTHGRAILTVRTAAGTTGTVMAVAR